MNIQGVYGYGLRLEDHITIADGESLKCTRCNREYNEKYYMEFNGQKINGLIVGNINSKRQYTERSVKMLCPRCCEELIKWLKNEKGE